MINKIECADKAVESISMSSLDLTVLIAEVSILTMCSAALTVILINIVRGE